MIVVVEAGVFQGLRLIRRDHAQGGTGLQAHGFHSADHGRQSRHIAVLQVTPGGAHAEALCPAILRGARFGEHLFDRHQLARF